MQQLIPRRPALRYHGGKWRLAPWIISHFPAHDIYTEAYGGAASVLLRKPRSYAEVYNDLDGEIVNVFRVLRERSAELCRVLELTPYARAEYETSHEPARDELEQARRTIVRSCMGHGANFTRRTRDGRVMRGGFRNYSKKNRRSIPAQDWRNYPEELAGMAERLRGVIIENRKAAEVICKHDSSETLHYVDPTYDHQSRGRKNDYRFEMTEKDHRELASVLKGLQGYVVLSGYQSGLYRELFGNWQRVEKRVMADGGGPRTEVLWLNPKCAEVLR